MKKIALLSMTVMMMAALPASMASASDLTFTTGGDQGTYYGFGSVLAGQVSGATDTTVTRNYFRRFSGKYRSSAVRRCSAWLCTV